MMWEVILIFHQETLREMSEETSFLRWRKWVLMSKMSHHEVAPGQHEIDFKYAEALKTGRKRINFQTGGKVYRTQT